MNKCEMVRSRRWAENEKKCRELAATQLYKEMREAMKNEHGGARGKNGK